MQPNIISQWLNVQQSDMIRLFQKPMPQEYYIQIRRLAVKMLGMQLDNTIDNWESEHNITEESYYGKIIGRKFCIYQNTLTLAAQPYRPPS